MQLNSSAMSSLFYHIRLWKEKLSGRTDWRQILPMQPVRQFSLEEFSCEVTRDWPDSLRSSVPGCVEGKRFLYWPPSAFKVSPFAVLSQHYPPDAGLKLARRPKPEDGLDEKLSLVANTLFLHGLGPRLYDTLEFTAEGRSWRAYVVAHVTGRKASEVEVQAGSNRLSGLLQQGLLRATDDAISHLSSKPNPIENDHAVMGETAGFQYLAFHHFQLLDYAAFLQQLALQAVQGTHFGMRDRKGRQYLYQAVPGVRLPAKRNVAARTRLMRELLKTAGVSLKDRLVLDVGCNAGMMMAEYNQLGAGWCHGWDRSQVTPHAERLLLALGCTRTSATAADLTGSHPLDQDLPSFLQPALRGCAISYLAIQQHVGWLDALTRIPWAVLIYEGRKTDNEQRVRQCLEELHRMVPFQGGPIKAHQDLRRRLMTVLVRPENL